MARGVALLAAAAVWCASASCVDDTGCSLNGVCTTGACVCDAPWGGSACAQLTFAVTPASAKNIYNGSDPRNTWGGPIAGPDAHGKYHAYVPLYKAGSLWSVETTLHGIADAATGPWDFGSRPNISSTAINPAFLAFADSSGATTYSLWTAEGLLTADSMDGPFMRVPRAGYAATNPAPIFYKGAFYATSQPTKTVVTAPSVHGPWTVFANISHPVALTWHVEVRALQCWTRGLKGSGTQGVALPSALPPFYPHCRPCILLLMGGGRLWSSLFALRCVATLQLRVITCAPALRPAPLRRTPICGSTSAAGGT